MFRRAYMWANVLFKCCICCSEVVQLLSRNFGQDDVTDPVESNRCYLVLLESDGGMPLSSWPDGKIKTVDASVEITIAVADLQVCTL